MYWQVADALGIQVAAATICVAIVYGIKKCGFDARIISTLRGYNDELRKVDGILTGKVLEAKAEQQAEK
jgi:hypothetical protein